MEAQAVCVSGEVWGCISVLEGSCCWISKKGAGHPRCIKVPSGCGSDLCEQEHPQQPQSWCLDNVGEEELFTVECLLRSAAGKESRHGTCGISYPPPGSQFRFCIWKYGELSLQGMSTVIIYSAENWGFFVRGLNSESFNIGSFWIWKWGSSCVLCAVGDVVLSLPVFLMRLSLSIEWDATINGNLLIDFRFCSYFMKSNLVRFLAVWSWVKSRV